MEHQAVTLTSTQLSTLEVLYRRVGVDRVIQYGLDSAVNQIPYNRHEEKLSVQKFAELLKPAVREFLESPIKQQMPCWSSVISCEKNLATEHASAGAG